MRTTPNGVKFIAQREACVLVAYQDGEHMSIGFGHNDPKLRSGHQISVLGAIENLKKDIVLREPAVSKALGNAKVSDDQFSALVSLYYQGGSDGLKAVCAHVKNGNLRAASEEFLRWDKNAAGKRLAGLAKRRLMEKAIFDRCDYGDLTTIKVWHGDPRKTDPSIVQMPEEI
jgi:GH24 family phage-related lysozyme (muramidase)